MELIECIEKLEKSKIKAGDGEKEGKYPLYTCSPKVNKFFDNYLYDTEAIILSTGGNPVINYHKGEFSYSTDCLAIKSNGEFENKYLYYYLISKINDIAKMFRGAGIKHLNKRELFKLNINLIDKKEQKIIVKNLDKINNVIELKKKQLNELDIIIKSQFVEMFGDPIINEKNWNVDTIKNVSPRTKYVGKFDAKVWILNLDMIESGTGNIIEYMYEDLEKIKSSTCTFNEEYVLYSKLRPYLNKVVVPIRKGYATSEIIPLKPDITRIEKQFLAYLLRSEQFVNYISLKTIGAKMPRVSMEIFMKFNLILPPLSLQNEFSEIVKRIDKQKFESMIQLKMMEKIYNIINDRRRYV